jgi:anthranilate phosphoribosyltransferase
MPNAILTSAIDALASGRDLSAQDTAEVLAEIMHGEVSETQIAGFLIALRTKGETVDELAGLARTMRALAAHVPSERDDLLDTAGTGGGRSSFNVSSTAALIAAGAGCAVAKHGNRSATSRSGSADLLEALGARIDLGPQAVADCIDEAGFGFMFAPAHHQATRFVVPVRRELAVRTIFNLLGPLTNPAGARRQLIGVSDAAFLERMAGALARLGVDRALVVAGEDGLDEVSASAPTNVVEVNGEELRRYVLTPREVGIDADVGEAPAGGTPAENAAVTRAILRTDGGGERGGEATAGQPPACAGAGEHVSARAETVLDRILAETRKEVERRKRERPLPAVTPARAAGERAFRDALAGEGIGVIAEFKRRSPSAGELHERPQLEEIVAAYERGGAVAVSILTEGPNFAGALEDLGAARGACALPLLRKDFIVDPYQLHEAAAAGADAVLLIVAALAPAALASLHAAARELRLDVLVEVHDRDELQRALALGAEVIGVNNRDLRDFSVEVGRTETLMGEVPADVIVVSESGIVAAEQVRRLHDCGVRGVLVGESLMRAPDPAQAVRGLTAWSRETI